MEIPMPPLFMAGKDFVRYRRQGGTINHGIGGQVGVENARHEHRAPIAVF
jgi:hypothetical protein